MKERKKQPKPKHFIDSSIYLEVALFGEELESCSDYLKKVGYKTREVGIISHQIMGEILANLFFKIEDTLLRIDAFKILEQIISSQISKNKIKVIKVKKRDYIYIKKIREIDTQITIDDASHLSTAISNNCLYFITIDKMLLNEEFLRRLNQHFKIKIRHPLKI